MFHLKHFFFIIFLHLITAIPQINLYYTDVIYEGYYILQHNCLRVFLPDRKYSSNHEIAVFCLSELPWIFKIEKSDFISKFTFAQLSKQNVTSEQLYLWSAPIDLIEDYQFYLNQSSSATINGLLLDKKIFCNCTLPRFGSLCQYELPFHHIHHSSLEEIIRDFYWNYEHNSTVLSCYIHLKCNRGAYPACLDWKEICDGKIDCLNDGVDEQYCWQLEINECQDNEYRCRNGQCISQSYYDDELDADCMDISDEPPDSALPISWCQSNIASLFSCEDTSVSYLTVYNKKRAQILTEAIYSTDNSSISDDCWVAFKCFLKFIDPKSLPCKKLCQGTECIKIVEIKCPNILYFPTTPVLFGHIYFVYKTNDLYNEINSHIPFYACYTTSQYNDFFITSNKTFLNNMPCVLVNMNICVPYYDSCSVREFHEFIKDELYQSLIRYHQPFQYTPAICNRSNMYQCIRSPKCISIYRLLNNINDCPFMDDEDATLINNTRLREHFNKTHFKCQTFGEYIHKSLVKNSYCNCKSIDNLWCEDEIGPMNYLQNKIIFQHICDGFTDILPEVYPGRNETDETECEQWQCSNIYTRCNGVWNCLNGADESGCKSDGILNCSSKYHLCILPSTYEFTCLPIEKANDDHVDCLGGTDEISRCEQSQWLSNMYVTPPDFYCMNQSPSWCTSSLQICDGNNDCEHGDDEKLCTNQMIENDHHKSSLYHYDVSKIKKFFLNYRKLTRVWGLIPFTLDGLIALETQQEKSIKNIILSTSSIIQVPKQYQPRCHRGLDLRIWLNTETKNSTDTCLCPPSYYGNQCQYQNQRISLTLQFQVLSTSQQTPFLVIVSLIDDSDQRIIHSHEQVSFLSIRDCGHRFNIYLLYSTRPKDSLKKYAIHIDFYEQYPLLNYRASVLLPIKFPFLPVHRLSFIVDIPHPDYNNNLRSCFNDRCIHGKCIRYSNNSENLTFCQCEEGWSGKYCSIQHNCTCSSDSKCIGISALNHRSICVCPLHKFGPRCLLTDTTCQTKTNDTCQHDSQCISSLDIQKANQKFVCICSKGYSGNRCEIPDKQLIISFDKQIVLSQSISIHFIIVLHLPEIDGNIRRATTLRTIPVRRESITIYWSEPFHFVFTEFNDLKVYYLTFIQKSYNRSTTINGTIYPSDRCPNITELFNQTFLQWNLLRRIKYYHLPCQNQSLNLSCFHDEAHLCLCYDFEHQRLANCFLFDQNMKPDCFGENDCENEGQCLQDKPNCPRRSTCICRPCYFGARCQFSTYGFGLSLDAILSYHIIPNLSFTQQPIIIKISLALVIIFILIGFTGGILSLITFKNKIVREVGCGLYLLASSIIVLFTMIMFGMKFLFLLLIQMSIISNKTFVQVQCYSLDFILRICLCTDQWLNACVALERSFTVIKATAFDKKQSKKVAKYVISGLLIIIIGTSIHDPIYRQLIDEENDIDDIKRTWCIVKYPLGLEVYNYMIQIFHFLGPFLVNLISSIILIIKKSHQQASVRTNQSYQEILRQQIQEHKHLLIAPIILVILALPRLIISFISKCMGSANDVWLYLIGYFISYVPPMLIFVVFIVPSKFYKKEFQTSVQQYRSAMQRFLQRRQ